MRRAYLPTLLILLALAGSVLARTWYVSPDGLGDAPTIQAGMDSAAAGDTVLVGCGIHFESNISVRSSVQLMGETGESDCAIIDAEREFSVLICSGCDSTTLIQGLTITGGDTEYEDPPPGAGGGMKLFDSSPKVMDCVFYENYGGYGGAVYIQGGRPTFMNCTFSYNYASWGSAICCDTPEAVIRNCTFADNAASKGTVKLDFGSQDIIGCTFYGNYTESGGTGIHCSDFSSPRLANTIIADGTSGVAITCDFESEAILTCCDVYGNAGGDWVGSIADQLGENGNISADPLFCDTDGGDFSVESCSPCLSGNHPDGYDCGGVIGAFGEGCACGTATVPSTWGAVKAMFR